MVKSPWENRVGMLLDPQHHPDDFVYSFKPADSAMYGGQPRIDWLACDVVGRFWMIEVKMLPTGRRSFSIEALCSPGQIAALSALGMSALGAPVLAVGIDKLLCVFDWRKIQWLLGSPSGKSSLLSLTDADKTFVWAGPKSWIAINLRSVFPFPVALPYPHPIPGLPLPSLSVPAVLGGSLPPTPGTVPTLTSSTSPSSEIPEPPSPSTSKPKGYIRTRRRTLLSGPSFAKSPD